MPENNKPPLMTPVEPKLDLVGITFDTAPRIPGVRAGDLGTIDCVNPTEPMRGWVLVVQGALTLLISPKSWQSGKRPREWAPTGMRQVYEIPRSNLYLHWNTDIDPAQIATRLAKGFTSEPFGKPYTEADFAAPASPKPINPAEIGDA